MAKHKPKGKPKPKTKPKRLLRTIPPAPLQLYTLYVDLIQGRLPDDFDEKVVSRTIQIRGDQTLAALHSAIYRAYDRSDEHLYEFQFGKRPMDRNAVKFGLDDTGPFWPGERIGGTVGATIESLNLKVGQSFFYWFDFGDDWWHRIDVTIIEPAPAEGEFPRVTERIGKSPPQYPDLDDEYDEYDEYDDEEDELEAEDEAEREGAAEPYKDAER